MTYSISTSWLLEPLEKRTLLAACIDLDDNPDEEGNRDTDLLYVGDSTDQNPIEHELDVNFEDSETDSILLEAALAAVPKDIISKIAVYRVTSYLALIPMTIIGSVSSFFTAKRLSHGGLGATINGTPSKLCLFATLLFGYQVVTTLKRVQDKTADELKAFYPESELYSPINVVRHLLGYLP